MRMAVIFTMKKKHLIIFVSGNISISLLNTRESQSVCSICQYWWWGYESGASEDLINYFSSKRARRKLVVYVGYFSLRFVVKGEALYICWPFRYAWIGMNLYLSISQFVVDALHLRGILTLKYTVIYMSIMAATFWNEQFWIQYEIMLNETKLCAWGGHRFGCLGRLPWCVHVKGP